MGLNTQGTGSTSVELWVEESLVHSEDPRCGKSWLPRDPGQKKAEPAAGLAPVQPEALGLGECGLKWNLWSQFCDSL